MADRDLLFKPALELAQLVRDGAVTARELTELALGQVEELNPQLNAFIVTDAERALAAADEIKPGDDRPFAGVPTAIKDIGAMLEGYPYTCGATLFGDFISPLDTYDVQRIKRAGFVITGKTNLPEFGILPVSESTRYGAVRNPYDTDRTPGGSSGGAAAAVASGMLPIAHGSDGAGSLRIPGACCGLVGFKPARNRVSVGPAMGESELATQGFLTRTVADSAATLDLLAGYEVGDANWAPPVGEGTFLDAARRDPGKLKIGFHSTPAMDVPVDPLHVQAVEETAKLLESLGHEVESFTPNDSSHMLPLFVEKWSVSIASLATSASRASGLEISDDTVERLTMEFIERGREAKAIDFMLNDATMKGFIRAEIASQYAYDIVLCPVLNQRPVPIGSIDANTGMAAFGKAAEFTSFTASVNLAGLPATSLPTTIGGDGLPTAIQLIGRPADEETLFSLAAQIEQAQPWAQWRPPVTAAA
ncbi:MAG: amidase [Solirubrobacterales bacterium]